MSRLLLQERVPVSAGELRVGGVAVSHWFKGLIAAMVGGAANGVLVNVVDPADFNVGPGWKKLATMIAASALVSAAMYLKQSPVPPDDDDPFV